MGKIKLTKTDLTKSRLLLAFDKSQSKAVLDLCRIAGVSPFTFYHHYRKDVEFKREIIKKRQKHLTVQISNI